MNVVAWIVLGALTGYLAGIGSWGEASTGAERVVLGVVGAIVGGYLMLATGGSDPLGAGFSPEAAAASVILAAVTVGIVSTITASDRPGRRTGA